MHAANADARIACTTSCDGLRAVVMLTLFLTSHLPVCHVRELPHRLTPTEVLLGRSLPRPSLSEHRHTCHFAGLLVFYFLCHYAFV